MENIRVEIAELALGASEPVAVQTMCNTQTQDIESSVEQCRQMAKAGAKLIRLTTQGIAEVEALVQIKRILRSEGITTPLVADVHFNSDVAIAAAKVADKVRINPGNFAAVHKDARSQFAKFIEVCKEYGTAVRIGLNHGSLGNEIVEKYGNTPQGMKEAVVEWLSLSKELDFNNIVVSLKASNTIVMSRAYELLHSWMLAQGVVYPMHLGVTEAGNADQGRIKSAIGIGSLLKQGIGDTIRVSLTENPVNEIAAGETIVNYYKGDCWKNIEQTILEQAKTEAIPNIPFSLICGTEQDWNSFIIRAACAIGTLLLQKKIDDFQITEAPFAPQKIEQLKEDLLQGARRKFFHPEYIACPGCGRTQYNLEETFNLVKEKTAHLKGVRIAVMGCIVNGPGEMADADYGYVGQGGGMVTIYKGKEPVQRNVPSSQAIDILLKIIEQDRNLS